MVELLLTWATVAAVVLLVVFVVGVLAVVGMLAWVGFQFMRGWGRGW